MLHCTSGYPGTQNDKTISRTDELIQALRKLAVFRNYRFHVFSLKGDKIPLVGAYAIVDGGYHRWRELQCAFKHAVFKSLAWAWSRWFGSTRKDVECLFGSMKKRFRILRDAMPFQYAKDIDNIMFTCCVLHNWLLRVDGKDTFSTAVPQPNFASPNPCANSDLGADSDVAEKCSDTDSDKDNVFDKESNPFEKENPNLFVENETKVEQEAGWDELRGHLIAHFTYLKETNKLKWQF